MDFCSRLTTAFLIDRNAFELKAQVLHEGEPRVWLEVWTFASAHSQCFAFTFTSLRTPHFQECRAPLLAGKEFSLTAGHLK